MMKAIDLIRAFPVNLDHQTIDIAAAIGELEPPSDPKIEKDVQAFLQHLRTVREKEERAVEALLAKPAVLAYLEQREAPPVDPLKRLAELEAEVEKVRALVRSGAGLRDPPPTPDN